MPDAGDVAANLEAIAVRYQENPRIDDIFVTDAGALLIRYDVGGRLLGRRVARLDIDPATGATPMDAARLASDLFHDLHTSPGPDPWTDPDGYTWWGESPTNGWPSVLDEVHIRQIRPAR